MARSGITALSFAVLLAVFEVGSCLRCFQCNSQSSRECMDPFQTAVNTVDCGSQSAMDYNRNYLRDVLPSRVIDGVIGGPRYCAKIVLQTGTTIRTCVDSNPSEPNQICRDLERATNEYNSNSRQQLRHCSVCDREVCNGAGSISASVPVAVLALVASYLYYKH